MAAFFMLRADFLIEKRKNVDPDCEVFFCDIVSRECLFERPGAKFEFSEHGNTKPRGAE